MTYTEAVNKISEELDIPEDVVDKAYKSFYTFIREKIKTLPFKEDLTEEEFSSLKTNFNIPAIGKLHCTYDRYLGMKERFKYFNKIKEAYEHKED
jgi:hypothetical protein